MTQERLQQSVNYLLSLNKGAGAYEELSPYKRGFFVAVLIWDAKDDPTESFRLVVENRDNLREDDAIIEGYDDALRMFQEAKSLD